VKRHAHARAAVPMTKVAEGLGHDLAHATHVLLDHVEAEWMWWAERARPKNRQALKKAWVNRWKIAAVQAPTPSAITM
jgi:hypothetical protein